MPTESCSSEVLTEIIENSLLCCENNLRLMMSVMCLRVPVSAAVNWQSEGTKGGKGLCKKAYLQ